MTQSEEKKSERAHTTLKMRLKKNWVKYYNKNNAGNSNTFQTLLSIKTERNFPSHVLFFIVIVVIVHRRNITVATTNTNKHNADFPFCMNTRYIERLLCHHSHGFLAFFVCPVSSIYTCNFHSQYIDSLSFRFIIFHYFCSVLFVPALTHLLCTLFYNFSHFILCIISCTQTQRERKRIKKTRTIVILTFI